jgi:hypothetical protein
LLQTKTQSSPKQRQWETRQNRGALAPVTLRADPTEKLEMLDALAPLGIKPGKFRPPDKLIAMLASG